MRAIPEQFIDEVPLWIGSVLSVIYRSERSAKAISGVVSACAATRCARTPALVVG